GYHASKLRRHLQRDSDQPFDGLAGTFPERTSETKEHEVLLQGPSTTRSRGLPEHQGTPSSSRRRNGRTEQRARQPQPRTGARRRGFIEDSSAVEDLHRDKLLSGLFRDADTRMNGSDEICNQLMTVNRPELRSAPLVLVFSSLYAIVLHVTFMATSWWLVHEYV
ncbi:unnamed protein product, partial [Ixodes pacificus]